jgi:hypothetical protein
MKLSFDSRYYNPQESLTSATRVGKGITIAKFLGSRGGRTQLEKILNNTSRSPVDPERLRKYLYLQSLAMTLVNDNSEFRDYRLIVSDGVYEPAPYWMSDGGRILYGGEIPTSGSVNDYRTDGRTIGYQLIGKNGKTDPSKSFDCAVFLKDYAAINKVTLDYDTYNPDGSLTSSIFLEMPEQNSTPWSASADISFKKSVCTFYNGKLQTTHDLMEILE